MRNTTAALLSGAFALLPMASAAENGLVFRLGAGVGSDPVYFGSAESDFGPSVAFEFAYLGLGSLQIGDPDPFAPSTGLSFGGSLRYVGARESADAPELTGLEDIDPALELGAQVTYAAGPVEVFAAARRGFGGHEGIVGEAGLDFVWMAQPDLELRLGPRLLAGDDEFAQTYFGVSADAAAGASFAAFEAEGGMLSRGVEFAMDWRVTDRWAVYGSARWDQLQNAAADSPVTGDDTQVSVAIGVMRVFDWRF